jgi:hypothetical protein
MVVTAAWSIEHSGARHALIDLCVTCEETTILI